VIGGAYAPFDEGGGPVVDIFLSQSDASGELAWRNRWTFPYQREANKRIEVAGVAVNGDGSVILTGSGNCGLDLGGGALHFRDCESHRAFVAKFDAHGASNGR
jgi:hypothetical protein